MKRSIAVLSLSVLFYLPLNISSAASSVNSPPDNSVQNRSKQITADQQKMNKADTDITARIRRDLMKDNRLSTYAQNVKIITVDGSVVLEGPVKTSSERLKIENIAATVVGIANVSNRLTIAN